MDALEERKRPFPGPSVSKTASVSNKQVLCRLRSLQTNSGQDWLFFLIVQMKNSPDVSCLQHWILIKYIQFQLKKNIQQFYKYRADQATPCEGIHMLHFQEKCHLFGLLCLYFIAKILPDSKKLLENNQIDSSSMEQKWWFPQADKVNVCYPLPCNGFLNGIKMRSLFHL